MLGLFSVGRIVLCERIVEFCFVFGTAQFENVIGIVNPPPGAGTFQPHVTDDLVGAFNSAVAEGMSTSTQFAGADMDRVAFVGSRALALLVGYTFAFLNLHRIWCKTTSGDARVARFYEQLGFQREGVLRQHEFVDGRYVDKVLCGLLRGELRQVPSTP